MQKPCGATCGQGSVSFRRLGPLLAVPLCVRLVQRLPLCPQVCSDLKDKDVTFLGGLFQEPRLSWADGVWRRQVQGQRGTGTGEGELVGGEPKALPKEKVFGNTRRRWASSQPPGGRVSPHRQGL